MRIIKSLYALIVLMAMASSPYMRQLSEDYVYEMGTLVYLLSSFITFFEGRMFEKVWAGGFLCLSIYSLINSFNLPREFYFLADGFYLGAYLMFFTGSAYYMWSENSKIYTSLMTILLLISPFVSYYLAILIEPSSVSRVGTFFNILYMFISVINVTLIFPPSFYDRAWAMRFLGFGIYAISEIWFFLWVFFGYEPTDISIIWLTPLIISILSQRMDIRRYFKVR